MSLVIPECQSLSLEGVRKILYVFNEKIEELVKGQETIKQEIKDELKTRPNIIEIVNLLANKPSLEVNGKDSNLMAILNSFACVVEKNISQAVNVFEKQEEVMRNLVEKVKACLKICHMKYTKALQISAKNLKYVHTHLHKQFNLHKKSKIFAKWKEVAVNTRQGFHKFELLSLHSNTKKKTRAFSRWKRNTSRISQSFLEIHSKTHENFLKLHSDQVSKMQNEYFLLRILDLQSNKADSSDVNNLSELALKSDLRIMFQDIKTIIKIHSENLTSVRKTLEIRRRK